MGMLPSQVLPFPFGADLVATVVQLTPFSGPKHLAIIDCSSIID